MATPSTCSATTDLPTAPTVLVVGVPWLEVLRFGLRELRPDRQDRAVDVIVELEQAPKDAVRSAFIDFAGLRGDDALWKSGGPEHLTASCFVFSPDLRQVLLTHHRKGGFWVQFGGHLEAADASLADAARREGREESGIDDLQLRWERVMDLDRHELHGGFTCAAHWDVGFVAVASPTANVEVSSESLDVRWFRVGALPRAVPPGFPARLAAVRAGATNL